MVGCFVDILVPMFGQESWEANIAQLLLGWEQARV